MATAPRLSPANYPEINGTTSSATPTFADAILDRIVHKPIGWNWTGRPLRKLQATEQAETAGSIIRKGSRQDFNSPNQASKRGPEMTAVHNFPPAPVANRDLPRAPLRSREGAPAVARGPSY